MRQSFRRDVQGRVQLLARDPLRRRRLAAPLLLLVALGSARTSGAKPAGEEPAGGAHKLTKPPKLVRFVEAPYPESEKAAGRSATVVLELAIDATGGVGQARVTDSAGPSFDAAAQQAARQFVFEPAEVDGKPAPIRILYRYEFVLRSEAPTTADLAGRVRDARTKKPLASVRVTVDGTAAAVTDADGRFHVDAVAPGQRTISL